MRFNPHLCVISTVVWLAGAQAIAGEVLRQEIPSRYASAELLRPVLKEALSPTGRFVILDGKGTVLVIDRAQNVFAAAEAIENLDVPDPEIVLNLGVRTGGRPRASSNPRVLGPVSAPTGIPYPTRYLPPRISGGPGGSFAVTPAHPINFTTRNVGTTMETDSTINPDGSIDLAINVENVEFQGFINYGSPVLRPRAGRAIPIQDRVSNPRFFGPAIEKNVQVPVFNTTRISTSVVVHPELSGNRVRVNLVPQLKIVDEEHRIEETTVPLNQYRTVVDAVNGKVTTISGFRGATDEFNRCFFCDEDQPEGKTALTIKPQIRPGKSEAE